MTGQPKEKFVSHYSYNKSSLCEYENVNSVYMSNDNEWEKNLLQEGTVLRIIGFIWTLFYNQLGLEDKLNKIIFVINK